MSLNLGLESLGIVSDDVSLESVYQAEAEFSDAQLSLERACFQAATEARNISNFNEIIDSLQRHSSQECVAFAQDLLGTSSLEKIEVPGTPPAKTFSEKMKGAWDAFYDFIKKCGAFIKKWTGKLLAKMHITGGTGLEGKIKVNYSAADLNSFKDTVEAPGNLNATDGSKLSNILKLGFLVKKPKKTDLDLAQAEDYIKSLQAAQLALVHLWTWTSGRTKQVINWEKKDNVNVGKGDLQLTTWLVHMMRRLKPFQKGIMSDFVYLMKRYQVTAGADVGAIHKFSKKTQDNALASKKIASRFRPEEDQDKKD